MNQPARQTNRAGNRAPRLRPGTQVGDFELLAVLGGGGQATAYLALPLGGPAGAALRAWAKAHLAHGRPTPALAARWRLATIKLAQAGQGAALFDEHTALAVPAAAHPGIVQLYSRHYAHTAGRDIGLATFGDAGAIPWLALAYEPGPTLADLLGRGARQPFPLATALSIAAQLASALDHLHRRLGLAHLDVKPGNVVLRPNDGGPRAILIDLGSAERLDGPSRGGMYGTLPYMAPERLAGAAADVLADIYGLGVLLRDMAGTAPPPALAGLIADMTEQNPARRRAAIPDAASALGRLEELS